MGIRWKGAWIMKYLNLLVKELESIMSKEPFDVEQWNGGNAVISVTDHWFTIEGMDAMLDGKIKYVVSNYKASTYEGEAEFELTDGFFEGELMVILFDEEHEFFEDLLINLN